MATDISFLRRRGLSRSLATAALVFVAAAGLWLTLLDAKRWARGTPEAFDVVTWELTAAPGKWLYALGAPLRRDPPSEEALGRYFTLGDRESEEAARLEGTAEAAVEGRLDATLRALGFPRVLGLSVWPPVDIELTSPPRVLAVSPRERIQLVSRTMLRPGLALGEAVAIEGRVEAGAGQSPAGQSAAVLPLGGLSTYPAIVTDDASYADTVEAAAHEWVHHYLAFHPLGWSAPGDRDALRINETVADIAAREIATAVLARFGDPTGSAADARDPASNAVLSQASRLADRDRTLRALRIEVDALLLDGAIETAEERMEAARLELAGRGINIRRLNQAYFAWTGTYAARGDSIDALGGQLRELRRLTGSALGFLEAVRSATSRADIARILNAQRALHRLEAAP